MVFQVITPKQMEPIEIGRQRVEFIYQAPGAFKETNRAEWLGQLKTEAGFAKVAGVEVTLLDICRYFHRAGGISGAAQAVHDLGKKADPAVLAQAGCVVRKFRRPTAGISFGAVRLQAPGAGAAAIR